MVKRILRAAVDSLRTRDERFMLHNVLATRIAGLVGGGLALAWIEIAPQVNGHNRSDLLGIGAAMVVVKLAATVYYHLRS
jgi:hypothetical protein